MLTVIDLTDALKQRLVERNLVLEVGQHGLHLLLYLANLIGLVGLNDGKEHTADTVERLATLLEGKDGVVEGRRILVFYDSCDFVALLLDSRLEGRQIVRDLNLTEVGGSKRQGALLQQRIFTLGFRAACQLHH